jgi:hypothetical protein
LIVTKLRKPWRSGLGSEEEREHRGWGSEGRVSRSLMFVIYGVSLEDRNGVRASSSMCTSCSGHSSPRSLYAGRLRRRAGGRKKSAGAEASEGSSSDCRGGGRSDLSQKGIARILLHSMPPAGAPTRPSSSAVIIALTQFPTFERIKRRVSRGFRGRRRGARHRHARPDHGRRTFIGCELWKIIIIII